MLLSLLGLKALLLLFVKKKLKLFFRSENVNYVIEKLLEQD